MHIQYIVWKNITDDQIQRVFGRNQGADLSGYIERVKPIIEDVRDRGDAALVEYEKKFNKAHLSPESLKVSGTEFDKAEKEIPDDHKAAIEFAVGNVRKHNEAGLQAYQGFDVEICEGVRTGERAVPIESVGLYVPGGKNLFPSTAYMTAIPAVVAGVKKIAMAGQAREDGSVNPYLLYTARLCGIENFYKISGAHGIAAYGFGTESVPAVGKILGPSGPYALAAKLALPFYGCVIDPGFPAGPSESIVLCDEDADPDNTVWDIINEAEHGADSAGLLVTHDKTLADYVYQKLPEAIDSLPDPQRQYLKDNMRTLSGIILTESLEESLKVVNDYAPEHVLIKTGDPRKVMDRIENAGCILLGEMTPNTLNNFTLGANHALPTGAAAKTYSGASITQYLKFGQIGEVTSKTGYDAVARPATTIARIEGFPGHEKTLTIREIKAD